MQIHNNWQNQHECKQNVIKKININILNTQFLNYSNENDDENKLQIYQMHFNVNKNISYVFLFNIFHKTLLYDQVL